MQKFIKKYFHYTAAIIFFLFSFDLAAEERKPSFVCAAFDGELLLNLSKLFLQNKYEAVLYSYTDKEVILLANGICKSYDSSDAYKCNLIKVQKPVAPYGVALFNPKLLDEDKVFYLSLILEGQHNITMGCRTPTLD